MAIVEPILTKPTLARLLLKGTLTTKLIETRQTVWSLTLDHKQKEGYSDGHITDGLTDVKNA
jgi:hypothetical protein